MDAPDHTEPLVLCVAGSPRRDGNSARLMAACVAGIEAAGGRADILVLATDRIPGCTGCNQCTPTGACVLYDAMTPVYRRIDAADAIMIAAPVYFATVPAPLKAFLDRCQPYWARRYVLGQPVLEPRRPGGLILVRGGGDPYGSECAIAPVKSAFAVVGVALGELLDVEGPDAPGDVDARPESLTEAEAIGRRLVAGVLAQR